MPGVVHFRDALERLKNANAYCVNDEFKTMVTIDTLINPPYLCVEGQYVYYYISDPNGLVEHENGDYHFRDQHGVDVVISAYDKRYK